MRKATNQRRRLARGTRDIADKVRDARKSLQRVTEQVMARQADHLALDAAGQPYFDRRPLTEQERVERLQSALTWLQRAEDETRQLRILIEKTLEHEWRAQ